MSTDTPSRTADNRMPHRSRLGPRTGRARRAHLPRVRFRPPSRVEANARLTGTTGIVILILLTAELVTVVLGAASVLSLHVVIGLILVPPILVKLASTTWRMVTYYLGAPAYKHRGPPPTLARILGPLLSLAIAALLISGGALILGPSPLHKTALQVHKVSFYLALLLILAHLAMHLTKAIRLTARDWVNRRGAALVTRARWTAVGGSVLLGALLALALAGHAEPYLHHYYGR
ncbi:MAG: hypothetical protein JO363_24160 [Solirubrobacterales bacterium]|nr:hypothetical protein [Solirubrobacterales bacterium]